MSRKPPSHELTEDMSEALDDLFQYFNLTDDSYSDAPHILVHTGANYVQGRIDTELHDILMKVFELVNLPDED